MIDHMRSGQVGLMAVVPKSQTQNYPVEVDHIQLALPQTVPGVQLLADQIV